MQNAWNKYGSENFSFEILYQCNENEDVNALEKYYIAKYSSNNQSIGYNLTSGGEGYKMNNEVKNRISMSKRGQKSSLTYEQVRQIKMCIYCNMDRNEIASIFNTDKKILTNISMGQNFRYVAPELNDSIHNLKQKMIDSRNDYLLELYDSGKTIKNIVQMTAYSESVVEKCIYKYRKVNKSYKLRKLSEEQEKDVINRYFKGNKTIAEISNYYNVSSTTIGSIINSYKNLSVS